MPVRIIYAPLLQQASEKDHRIKEIAEAFRAFKEDGVLGTIIGRDGDLGRPEASKTYKLRHTHLYPAKTKDIRGVSLIQYSRKSDIFLMYCAAIAEPDCYCLLDIIWENAHKKINNFKYILDELVPVASRFRERF